MKTINNLFLCIIVVIFSNTLVLAYTSDSDFNEIVFSAKKYMIKIPKDYRNGFSANTNNVFSKDLITLFNDYKILSIYKAFEGISPDDSIRYSSNGKKIDMGFLNNVFVIKISKIYNVNEVINKIENIPGIAYAENNRCEITLCGDPNFTNQWYLKNTGQYGGKIGADINIEPVWQFWTGDVNSKVAVIDCGVLLNHIELSGRVTGDPPCTNELTSNCDKYHGTMVAGIIGAAHNNSLIKGIDPNTQIISKSTRFPNYDLKSESAIADNIVSAVNEGANVLNFSWLNFENEFRTTIRLAFRYAYYMNRTCVCATGNDHTNEIQYPVGYGPEIISVGSSTDQDLRSSFSNYPDYIDIVAPGGNSGAGCISQNDDIFSISGPNTNDFLRDAGTSYSAPQVTGVASLMKSYRPDLYNDDIQAILQFSSDDIGELGWDKYTGYGRLNANNAFKFLRSPYIIERSSSTGGIEDTPPSDWYIKLIYAGSLYGRYNVKRHLIKKTINFSEKEFVKVWGRGIECTGWGLQNPECNIGFCGVLPNSLTNSSVTLYTYIYEIRSADFYTYLGYYPCEANQTVFAYSILSGPPPPSPAPVVTNIRSNMIGDPGYGYVLYNGQTGIIYPTITGASPYTYWSHYICESTNEGTVWPFNIEQVVPISGRFDRNLFIKNNGFTGALCPPCDKSVPTSLYLQMRLMAYNNYGSTNTRCKIIPLLNYASGGCPFMFVLGSDSSGGKYFIENNILHRSEFSENSNQNITDVYKLNTTPKLDSNKISIQLMETEHDISYLDQIKLYAIDHPVGTKIGITESNDIVMYYTDDILSSDDAVQNYNGNNITSLIQYGQSIPQVSGIGNSDMYAHFDSLSMNKKLLRFKNRIGRSKKISIDSLALLGQMGSDGIYNPAYPIGAKDWAGNVSIYTNTDTYIKPFAKRERVSDVIIPFSQTSDNVDHVEINFNSDYEMTYFTVTPISYEGFTKTEMPLGEATHSTLGSVLELLGTVDNNMVTMDTTAIVDLKFNYIYSQDSSLLRDYVFVVNGQYNSPNKSTKKLQMSPLSNNIHNSVNIHYKYKLNANYPNPFNPVTKINYELEKPGFTKLEVFDILGRLVDVLIKEYKQAGNYTLDFNGSHLSSGVYFYKIQSNDFVDIKRMVLIK